jgi:hypothetical protein
MGKAASNPHSWTSAKQGEQRISQPLGVTRVMRFQRNAQALFLESGEVDGQMAPPGAIVVPKMVVGVAGTATNGQFRMLIH